MNAFLSNTRGTSPEMWIRLALLFGRNSSQYKKLDFVKELFFFTLGFSNNSRLHNCYKYKQSLLDPSKLD